MYTGTKVKLTTDFLSETMQDRRQWSNICQVLKEKCQQRIPYPMKTSFKTKDETFHFSEDRLAVLSPTPPTKYNKKSWTLYVKQT